LTGGPIPVFLKRKEKTYETDFSQQLGHSDVGCPDGNGHRAGSGQIPVQTGFRHCSSLNQPVMYLNGADFAKFLQEAHANYGKLIKELDITIQ
jgi:hypothetical protein